MTAGPDDLPTYAQLLDRTDAPAGSSWGLFGQGPAGEMGTLALLTPVGVLAGARAVQRGAAFRLDYPLDAFDPPIVASRLPPQHRITSRHRDARDDVLDGWNPQSSSQIDGLRHRRHPVHGFYNGVPDEEVDVGTPALGVNRWAERGLAGRGVLLDLARWREQQDRPIDHESGEVLKVADLDEVALAAGVQLLPGDVVVLRTGWAGWYLGLRQTARSEVRERGRYTGFDQSRATLAWLWDHRLALVASDTFAFEAWPPAASSPFVSDTDGGMMHPEMLGLLGLALGELWRLDELAEDCAQDGRSEFLLVISPLHQVGGVASPANATAVK